MTRLLSLFQIKTVRSAWALLFGSALLVIFGAYQVATSPAYPSGDPRRDFDITFLSFWFVVGVLYMGIASWALFSAAGREYLEAQERIPIKGNRTILWYLKFLFACCAAAFATMMFLGVLALPFVGYAVLDAIFSPNSNLYLLITGLFWSPLIFRYLK